MNCKQLKKILNDMAPAQSDSTEWEALDRHLAICADCREAWRIQALLDASPVPPTPPSLATEVRAALLATPAPELRRSGIRRSAIIGSLLLAGAAAAAVLSLQMLESGSSAESVTDSGFGDDAAADTSPAETSPQSEGEVAGSVTDPSAATATAAGEFESSGEQIALDPALVVVLPVVDEAGSEAARAAAVEIRNMVIRELEQSELALFDPKLAGEFVAAGSSDDEIGRSVGAGTVVQVRTRVEYGSPSAALEALNPATDRLDNYGNFVYDDASPPSFVGPQLSIDLLIFQLERALNPEPEQSLEAVVAEMEALMLNPNETDQIRAEAIGVLRHRGPEAMTRVAVTTAVDLGTRSNDPDARRVVWTSMTEVDDPYLTQPLLSALADDPTAEVRRAAATALAVHADETGVRDALDYAAVYDEDSTVRAAAAESALTQAMRQERARGTFFDTSLSISRRIDALRQLYTRDGRLVVDADVAEALLDIASEPSFLQSRETALIMFSGIPSPGADLAAPLLALFRQDPEPRVRAKAAMPLKIFGDRPDVHEALSQAAQNDPDRRIRNAASYALAQE